jgi:DNA-binding response OmpR family regulator
VRLGVLGVMARLEGSESRGLRWDGDGPWRALRGADGKRRLPRVLIVDEHHNARELYAWSLRASGWSVMEVDSSKALFAATVFEPDVIVIDLGPNVSSGIASALQLRRSECTAHTPTVICCAVTDSFSGGSADGAEAGALQPRPYSPEELRALLEELTAEAPTEASSGRRRDSARMAS